MYHGNDQTCSPGLFSVALDTRLLRHIVNSLVGGKVRGYINGKECSNGLDVSVISYCGQHGSRLDWASFTKKHRCFNKSMKNN